MKNRKFKGIVAASVATAMIATATSVPEADAAVINTPVGQVNIPDQTIQGILGFLGAASGIGAIIALILSSQNGNSGSSNNSSTPSQSEGNSNSTTTTTVSDQTKIPSIPTPVVTMPTTTTNTPVTYSPSALKAAGKRALTEINNYRYSVEPNTKVMSVINWSEDRYVTAQYSTNAMVKAQDVYHPSENNIMWEASIFVVGTDIDTAIYDAVRGWKNSPDHNSILLNGSIMKGAVSFKQGTYEEQQGFYVAFNGI